MGFIKKNIKKFKIKYKTKFSPPIMEYIEDGLISFKYNGMTTELMPHPNPYTSRPKTIIQYELIQVKRQPKMNVMSIIYINLLLGVDLILLNDKITPMNAPIVIEVTNTPYFSPK